MSVMKLSECLNINQGVAPSDISSAKTSSYASMKGVGRVLAQATAASHAEGKKITVQLKQAKDSSGTSAKNLGDAVTATAPTGGGTLFAAAEAVAADMDINNGFTHVAVTLSSDAGSAVQGAAILVLGDLSFRS